MKKTTLALTVILFSFGAIAQDRDNVKQKELTFNSGIDTLQYALGAHLGQWMVKNNFQVQNANLFLLGMDDVLNKRKLAIPDSIITPLIVVYQQATLNEKSKLLEQQLFSSLKGKTGVGVLPNGVHYIIRRQDEGVRPTANNTVSINAVGVLPDGSIFEDTYKKKQPITTSLNNIIPGLKEVIQLMPVGSVWRIFIPSELGYGAAGLQNVVPPYSALVYDIELLEIKDQE
ncbi:FKBP-type peptidyl-prolyl cis-trans isomerase [Bacteroidota bacterium]